jgi:hypothetical protein
VVTAITAGASYLIADYFFKTRAAELALKGQEIADTVEYFVDNDPSRRTLMRYLIAVDRLVGARVWLFDANFNLIAASNVDSDLDILRDNTGRHPLSLTLSRFLLPISRCVRRRPIFWTRN